MGSELKAPQTALAALAILLTSAAAAAKTGSLPDRGVAGATARSRAPRFGFSVAGFLASVRDPRLANTVENQHEGAAGGYLLACHYERMLPVEHVGVRALVRYVSFQTERREAEGQDAPRILEVALSPTLRLPEFGRRAKFELTFTAPFALGASNVSPNARRDQIHEKTYAGLAYGFGAGIELAVHAERIIPFAGFELAQRYATHRTTYVDTNDPTRRATVSEPYSLFTAGVLAGIAF